MRVEKVKELKGHAVEWVEPKRMIVSRRNAIYEAFDENGERKLRKIAQIKAPLWKTIASSTRLTQRLLRFMVTNLIPLKNEDLFVAFDKSIGIIREGFYRQIPLLRPCRILRSSCAIDNEGNLFFGEYLSNPDRTQIRIYRCSLVDLKAEVVYTFPAKSVRHVHGVYFDQFDRSFLCLTGDMGRECKMIRFQPDFKGVDVIGEGDETWRAVSVLFTEDSFYYGTDAELSENYIYKVDRKSGRRESICEVDGTVYYSKKIGQWMFFATTAEKAPSQRENVASIWVVNSKTDEARKIVTFKKDVWNGTLFMFGTIHFPFANLLSNELYFHLVALKGDNQTFRILIS